MKHFLFIVLALTACTSANTGESNPGMSPEKPIDTLHYAVFKFNSERDKYHFDKGSKPTTLSYGDIIQIENLIKIKIADHDKEQQEQDKIIAEKFKERHKQLKLVMYDNAIHDPSKYKKQLIPIINSKGEKEVWVNCFCSDPGSYWKKEIVIVDDGGNCFFQIKINLTKHTAEELSINGPG